MFKALSNPNRLRIFQRLVTCCQPGELRGIDARMPGREFESEASEGCACVGELGRDLGIVASTISHHIKELRQAGLIRVERNGKNVECSVDQETVKALKGFFT